MKYNEYETLKLVSFDDLYQEVVADRIEVSRPNLPEYIHCIK